MPNNENNYRIQLEFASFLRGLPGFRITRESVGFVNVEISQVQGYHPHYIIEQLFKELEKDYVDHEELMHIGRIFKKYLLLLKQIDIDRTYYRVTPGLMAGLFIVLHLSLLFFPDNRTLMYSSLMADLYGLGFWVFSVWSSSQHERALGSLENKLIKKISFLKSLSFPRQINPYYLGSSASRLPSYEDVLLEDATSVETPTLSVTTSLNRPNFFYSSSLNNEREYDTDNTDPRPERCYSV
ncbi:hypothetical protein [Rickettsiella endosymbiont of Miltochrista miniata]|uniref:hypothetical protein n=1 Tax=Rickettsiella endosymbiont of Miltochrista miniata TaxID=3066239 RepID=UPI00313AD8EA